MSLTPLYYRACEPYRNQPYYDPDKAEPLFDSVERAGLLFLGALILLNIITAITRPLWS